MRYGVSNPPHNEWYSKPVGCGYTGKSYWRVWVMNELVGGDHFECIARFFDRNAAKNGVTHAPILKGGDARRGDGWYCR